MEFELCALRERIIERYKTLDAFAEVCGISAKTLSLKLNGHRKLSFEEISLFKETLEISDGAVDEIFFKKV